MLRNVSLKDPMKILIPEFRIYDHDISNTIADDKKNALSLKKMAKRAKLNKVIYTNLADTLLDGEVILDPPINKWHIMSIVSMSCLVAHTLVIAYLMYRVHIIYSVYVMVANQEAHASGVSLVYSIPTTEAPLDILSSIKENIETEDYILAVQIFILMCSVIILYNLTKVKGRRSSNIVFHLTNGHECFDLVVFEFRTCILEFDISFPNMPVTFEVYGTLRPEIEIHWADFKVVNRATSQEMHVRDKFQLNPIQAYLVRNIIKAPYSSHLYIDDRGVQFQLNKSGERRNEVAALYPSLGF